MLLDAAVSRTHAAYAHERVQHARQQETALFNTQAGNNWSLECDVESYEQKRMIPHVALALLQEVERVAPDLWTAPMVEGLGFRASSCHLPPTCVSTALPLAFALRCERCATASAGELFVCSSIELTKLSTSSLRARPAGGCRAPRNRGSQWRAPLCSSWTSLGQGVESRNQCLAFDTESNNQCFRPSYNAFGV